MKKKESKIDHIDSRIIRRIRIYVLIMLIIVAVIIFEVIMGRFNLILALMGIILGIVVGIIVGRVYTLSWDEETNKVVSNIDGIGAVILVCYLIFVFTKTDFFSNWVQGNPLFAVILGITAGTMLGRVLSTRKNIEKIFESLRFN